MQISAQQVKELREKTGAGLMDCKAALQEAAGDQAAAETILRKKGLSAAAKKAGRLASEGLAGAFVAENGRVAALVELNCETDFVAKNPEFLGLLQELGRQILGASALGDVDSESGAKLLDAPYLADPGLSVGQVISNKVAKFGENIALRRFARYDLSAKPDHQVGSYVHGPGKIAVLVEVRGTTDDISGVMKDLAMQVAAANPRFASRAGVTPEVLATEREIYKAQAAQSGKPENVIAKIVEGKMEKFYQEFVFPEQVFVKDDKFTVAKMLAARAAHAEIERFARFAVGEGLEKRGGDFAAEVAAQLAH